MDAPHQALFQEDQQETEMENEFSESQQQQMKEIWARLKAKKESKHPRTSTSNTSATGSLQQNQNMETPIQPFRQLTRESYEHSTGQIGGAALYAEPTSSEQLLFDHAGNLNFQKHTSTHYSTSDGMTRLTPQSFLSTAVTPEPPKSPNEQYFTQTLLANERQLTDKERLDFLNTDNVKLFLENRHLTQENFKLKEENQLLKGENTAMKGELVQLRTDFAHLSKNSISIEAFKAEMTRMTALVGDRQRIPVSPPGGRYTLERQHSPIRHQSPSRLHVVSPPIQQRLVRSPPKHSMIIQQGVNQSHQQPNVHLLQQIANLRNQLNQERVGRPGNLSSEDQIRWQERQRELISRLQTLEKEKSLHQTQLVELRSQVMHSPIQQQQYNSRVVRQEIPSAVEAELRSLKETNARLLEESSKRIQSPQAHTLDPQKQRQLRNAKLIYETENSKLRQELSSKQARISQLMQELSRSERSDSGAYDAARYSTPGSRPC